MNSRVENRSSSLNIVKMVSIGIGGIVALIVLFNLFGINKTGENVIVQDLMGGLHVKTTPGPYGKWLGHVDIYRQVVTVAYGDAPGHKSYETQEVPVIFNDGTRASIKALVRIALPTSKTQMITIRNQYAGGYDHFVSNGVVPVGANAIKLSANLRSAREAYTTLAVLQSDIEDQLMFGTYVTRSVEKWVHKGTGDSERVRMTEVVMDSVGKPMRRSTVLEELGCKVTQVQIEVPKFDQAVDDMIKMQRDQTLQTEIAKQKAIRAAQDALTAEANGKAEVMKAKYERETEKQKAITDAERDTMVAYLGKKSAEYKKQTLILEGQGEAEKRKLVMSADGALAIKLDAYKAVQEMWANAFSKFQGNIVPTTQMGTVSGGGNGATAFMELMTAKAAKDLALEPNPKR